LALKESGVASRLAVSDTDEGGGLVMELCELAGYTCSRDCVGRSPPYRKASGGGEAVAWRESCETIAFLELSGCGTCGDDSWELGNGFGESSGRCTAPRGIGIDGSPGLCCGTAPELRSMCAYI
jgi:hypothetical protein